MMEGLKRYSTYKPAGVLGLALVPEHWSTPRLKTLFAEVDSRSGTGSEPLLSLRMQAGLVDHHQAGGKPIPPSALTHYKVTRPGELVMNRMRAAAGLFGVPPKLGLVSPDYAVLRPRRDLVLEYYLHLFRTPLMKSAFRLESRGLGTGESGFLRLYTERFGMLSAPRPPIEEQRAIVRFIDHADRRIRRYIHAKQKLIKLLEEKRQTSIHEAVTRGLYAGVPTKATGLPWVPQAPSHWALVPNRAHLKIRKVLVGARHTEYQLLSLTKRGVIVRDISENKGKFSADMGTSQEVRPGDLVFCLFDVPETPRTVGLSHHAGMITGAYTVFECADPSVARFLEAFYIAMDDRKLLSPLYSGLRNTIPKERLLGAKTPLPPAAERQEILSRVAVISASHERVIEGARRELELLREIRIRLIADVVTGQLDVRAAAAALADEIQDAELVAEDEDGVDEEGQTAEEPVEEDAA